MFIEITAIISAAAGCYAAAKKFRGPREVRCAYCATPASGTGENCINCGAPAPQPPQPPQPPKPVREYCEDPWLMP